MSNETALNRALANLDEEYAEGFIDQKTYNRRMASLERERREMEGEELMARTSRIESVRRFLEMVIVQAKGDQDKLALNEDFEGAAMVKSFKDVLVRALELCGKDKPKEVTDGTKT